jgi:hypothetical protein
LKASGGWLCCGVLNSQTHDQKGDPEHRPQATKPHDGFGEKEAYEARDYRSSLSA